MNTWLLPAVAASLLIGAPQSNWTPFRCPEGGFAVSMPDRPREEVRMMHSKEGPIPMHRFISYSQGSPIVYIVTYQKLSSAAARMPMGTFLDLGARAASKDINGRLVKCRHRSIQGFPGRETAITNDQGMGYHSRICVANGRLYQVIVGGTGNQAFSPDATRFLSSFRISTKA